MTENMKLWLKNLYEEEAENHSATSDVKMRTNPLYSKKLWTIVRYPSYLKIPLGRECSLTHEARDGALFS